MVYLTYQCNLRCPYCVINFSGRFITYQNLDNLISFVVKNKNLFEKMFIEFIGGEPLLAIDKIAYVVDRLKGNNIVCQITTNGTLINKKNYNKVLSQIDIVNLSYNSNYFQDNSLFSLISGYIVNKARVNINFIYNPGFSLEKNKNNFLFILKYGYKNINILPIVLTHYYSKQDFANLISFIEFTVKFRHIISLYFIYYLQEKNSHFEFTIDPDGYVLGDNMGTAEKFFNVKNVKNKPIGHIKNISLDEIFEKLKNYSYLDYLKNISCGYSVQSYDNLVILSKILKKYNDKISFRNRVN